MILMYRKGVFVLLLQITDVLYFKFFEASSFVERKCFAEEKRCVIWWPLSTVTDDGCLRCFVRNDPAAEHVPSSTNLHAGKG